MNRQEISGRARVTGAVMALRSDTGWQIVSPTVAQAPHLLAGVAVASPTEVWVTGHVEQHPLIARWDGTTWTNAPAPPPDPSHIGAGFQGIAAAPGRAIAVGGAYDRVAGTEVPLIQHWNGTSWERADPDTDGYVLTDVTFIGEEAWAVGHGLPWGGPSGPVALHWSANTWRPASLPSITKGKLLAVSGTAPDDLWAVGAADRAGLIMHYDGHTWTRVPSPTTRFPLSDVVALSPSEAWAVGRDRVLHWNGRKWSNTKTPVTAANTITARTPDDLWVAGGGGELAHYDGQRWTLTTSPQPPGETAVWLASAAQDGGIWIVGSIDGFSRAALLA
ncbi:WD40/YVTN/BNR-like repeat-containing protein [Actinomadura sp. 9N407]|uniref:WD40/YVTN/BNR-like repeat-containing protein n=1 Tax=Actinomadura sp. 9N407 TaxID=3375154 RepID=UPI0037A8A18B